MVVATETVYRIKRGSGISARDATPIVEGIKAVEAEHGGTVSPPELLEAAWPEDAVLHRFFEWHDPTAAEQWRLWQARHLLNSVVKRIVYTRDGPEEPPQERWVRFYHSVHVPASDSTDVDMPEGASVERERRYASLDYIIVRPELRDEVVENAERELEGWRRRYRDYRGLPNFPERLGRVLDILDDN